MKYSLCAVQCSIVDAMNRPAEFRGDDVAVAAVVTSAALPQRLDAVERGAGDLDAVGIPQRRPAQLGQLGCRGSRSPWSCQKG